jgi:hypothetical protein
LRSTFSDLLILLMKIFLQFLDFNFNVVNNCLLVAQLLQPSVYAIE